MQQIFFYNPGLSIKPNEVSPLSRSSKKPNDCQILKMDDGKMRNLMKKVNWSTTIILAAILLLVFLVTRFFMSNFYTPEWSARNIFWVVALIVLATSFFNKARFSISALTGYLLGMLAGELFGGYQKDVPPQYLHYGWLIQIVIFFAFCLLGIWMQKKRKIENQ